MARRGDRFAAPVPGDVDDPMSWRSLVDAYLLSLELKALSPATVYGRRKALALLAGWSIERDIMSPVEVGVEVVDAYQRHLHRHVTKAGTPLTVRSQQQYLIAARGMFGWLTKQRHMAVNPTAELELPKGPHRLPRHVLTADQAEQVLTQPDISTLLGLRDRTMLEVLYATGIRRAELTGLDVGDANLTKRTLFVREGKGAKDRIVPLGERATTWISRYLIDARTMLLHNDLAEPALFVTRTGNRLCTAHTGKTINTYLRAGGISEGSCHLFRHTLATLMLEGGADIRWVQAMLGHHNLTSTQIYTHVNISHLAQIHAATHPATTNQPTTPTAPVAGLKHRTRP